MSRNKSIFPILISAAIIATFLILKASGDTGSGNEKLVKVENTSRDESATKLELPKKRNKDIIVTHIGYTLSYNPDYVLANWVAYELVDRELEGDSQRQRNFQPDPSAVLKKYRLATHQDYTRSGWVRGHLAPAADMKWNQKACDESFYTSNIAPMKAELNNGIWKRVEEKVRKWAQKYERVWVITGPVIGLNKDGRIGENHIVVPDAFFKAVLVPYNGSYLTIGFLMENKGAEKGSRMRDFALPVTELEEVTGIEMFYQLNRETAHRIKKGLPLKELELY